MVDGLPDLAGQRFLITGGCGFLAANLVAQLADEECQLARITRVGGLVPLLVAGRARCEHLVGDIVQRAFWEAALPGADVVFHFAAQTSVYTADQNSAADWQANVLPLLTLLETCRMQGHRPLILFAGTCTQFGLPERTPDSLVLWLATSRMAHRLGGMLAGLGMTCRVSFRCQRLGSPASQTR